MGLQVNAYWIDESGNAATVRETLDKPTRVCVLPSWAASDVDLREPSVEQVPVDPLPIFPSPSKLVGWLYFAVRQWFTEASHLQSFGEMGLKSFTAHPRSGSW